MLFKCAIVASKITVIRKGVRLSEKLELFAGFFNEIRPHLQIL